MKEGELDRDLFAAVEFIPFVSTTPDAQGWHLTPRVAVYSHRHTCSLDIAVNSCIAVHTGLICPSNYYCDGFRSSLSQPPNRYIPWPYQVANTANEIVRKIVIHFEIIYVWENPQPSTPPLQADCASDLALSPEVRGKPAAKHTTSPG